MTTPSDPQDQQPEKKEQGPKEQRRKQKRRGRGEGTVYQRRDGRWVAEITLEDGRRKPLYGKTQAEAIEKLKQAQYELKQGTLATGPKQSVKDLFRYWLEQVHRRKLRASTYVRYRGALEIHIIPVLGQVAVQKLTMRHIQQFYNKKLDEGQSRSSVHVMHKVIHQALDYAVKERLLAINPSTGVSLPSPEKRKIQPLTLEQAQHLLQIAQGTMMEPLIALALTVGTRIGELLALRWSDLNFEAGMVYIHRSLTQTENLRFTVGDPKTEAGERTLLLPQPVLEILTTHRTRQLAERLKAGTAWQHHDLVFCTNEGKQYWPNTVRRRFYRLVEKAGLPRMHFHDLRHHAATLLANMGVNPKVVQEILGHSDIEMTMNIYTHTLPSMQQEAAEKMKNLFERPS
jgi:integrase